MILSIFKSIKRRLIAKKHNQQILQNQPDVPINPLAFISVDEIKSKVAPKVEPEITRLEKLQRVYDHFEYGKLGLTFNDYVRKVNCGTWQELARA